MRYSLNFLVAVTMFAGGSVQADEGASSSPNTCKGGPIANLRGVASAGTPDDPRMPLPEAAEKLKLSKELVERIRVNSGYCYCPGTGKSSCFLVGDGSTVVTAAHVAINEEKTIADDKPVFWEPLNECVFENTANPKSVVKLDFSDESKFKFKTLNPRQHRDHDIVYVKLAGKIPGAHPFPLDTSDQSLINGQRMMVVSSHHLDLDKKVNSNDPLVQMCNNVDVYPMEMDGSRTVETTHTDCRFDVGGSGSMGLVKGDDNEWHAKVVIVAIGSGNYSAERPYVNKENKGLTYDEPKKIYTYGVTLNGTILSSLRHFTNDQERLPQNVEHASLVNPAPQSEPKSN